MPPFQRSATRTTAQSPTAPPSDDPECVAEKLAKSRGEAHKPAVVLCRVVEDEDWQQLFGEILFKHLRIPDDRPLPPRSDCLSRKARVELLAGRLDMKLSLWHPDDYISHAAMMATDVGVEMGHEANGSDFQRGIAE